MMHPCTELRFIDADIGFGVFTTGFMPAGTITYVQDELDICIDENQYQAMDLLIRENVDRYAFIDQNGSRVVCWDHAKYVNHCCHANTISTGYGFEIAIRDISAGEQVTDDYGLFNLPFDMEVSCGREDCRKRISQEDIVRYHPEWDKAIIASLKRVARVPQPLIPYLEPEIKEKVYLYIAGESEYLPVLGTRYQK